MNPFKDRTYGQSLALLAERYGDREALVFHDRRYGFRDVKAAVDRASARLVHLGLERGDKIAVWLPNRPEFLWYWLGAAQAGLVPVVLNTRLRIEEAAYQIGQSDSRAIVVPGDGAFRDFLGDLLQLCPELAEGRPGALGCARLPKLDFVLACDPTARALPGVSDWSRPAAVELSAPPATTDPMAPAMIAYSSGTTALPKGAVLNHTGFRKAYDHGERFRQTEDDRLYLCVPLFGILASINGVLTFWSRGSCVVLGERFDAGGAIAAIERERCTAIYVLPQMIDQILAHPQFRPERIASLRTGIVVSVDPTMQRRAVEQLGLREMITSYGMTETSSACTRTYGHDPLELRLRTQGRPLPDIEVKIADVETGVDLPAGEEGEILVRGYNVMLGYYNKPEETAAAFTSEGYFRTGDLGRMSEDGYVTFLRRVKDGYKHNGFNVATAEVEAAIAGHPDVTSAAVVGLPDRLHGAVGAAFVIPRQGRSVDLDRLTEFLHPRLASYKLPAHVFEIDAFPLTAGTGKIQKFKLREMALERLAATGGPPA